MISFSCFYGRDKRTKFTIRIFGFVVLLVGGEPAYSGGRAPLLVTTDEAIDLNSRQAQASALSKDQRVPHEVIEQLKILRPLMPPPAWAGQGPASYKDSHETITDIHKAEKQLANGILLSLINKQANVGVRTPSATYLLNYEVRRSLGNGYAVEPVWSWTVSVNGEPSDVIGDQKQSKVQSLTSLRGKGAAAPADSNEDVSVVGTYREDERATDTFGRIAFIGPRRKWGFDQIYGHKDTKRSEFSDVILLDDTNELLVLGNADDKIWLVKLDIAAKWVLWDRVYDLIKFRVTPIKEGIALPNLKMLGAKLTRTINGEIVIVGTVVRQSDTDLLVVLLTPEGKIKWARACGGSGVDSGKSVYAMSDGSIIVGGQSGSKRNPSMGWLLKLDNDGYVVWEKSVGSESVEGIYLQKADCGFLCSIFRGIFIL
jgi:hypothetical protein